MFCFVKQKTAYALGISDWISDVCSSNLPSDGRNPLVLNRPLSGSTDLGEPSSDLARFLRQCHSPCRSFRLHGLARGARSELMFRQSSRYSNDVLILCSFLLHLLSTFRRKCKRPANRKVLFRKR